MLKIIKKSSLLLFFAFVLLVSIYYYSAAAPLPPKVVVNHETRECAEIFGGDECMDCFPPPGWEVLGFAYDVECPEDYTFVEVDSTCNHFKEAFCCTEGHSGVHGDCDDMVINHWKNQCAFVDDVNQVELPFGWTAKPEDQAGYQWACPYDTDSWIDDVNTPVDGGGTSAPILTTLLVVGAACGCLLVLILVLVIIVIIRRKSSI